MLPIADWLPRYDRSWLRGDLTAGIAVTALVVPKNLGYAGIAGVPIENGLYAAAAGAIIYALFCTSRQISTGPSSSLAAVAGGAVLVTKLGGQEAAQLVAAITLVTFLVLIVVLRAIPLAAIAVGLNLLTVGVAFGILTLLFEVPQDWPLGGHNYVDAIGAMMIFAVVFGLSIDYAVFLLSRMREHYDREGDHAAAIRFGLDKTARVITGAAAIMMAVFIAFAGAPSATVSQLGVGLTVAVILDATVVRIILLPALMLLIGERVWWLPRGLQRALPKFDV